MAKKKKSSTVKVRFQARCMATFDQVRELPVEQWERLKKMRAQELTGEGIGGIGAIMDYLNSDDWDGGTFEPDFEIAVVDDDGNPIKPADEWEPN